MDEHYLAILSFQDEGKPVVIKAHLKATLEGTLEGGIYADDNEESKLMEIYGTQDYINSNTRLSFTVLPRNIEDYFPMDYKVTKNSADEDLTGIYQGHMRPTPQVTTFSNKDTFAEFDDDFEDYSEIEFESESDFEDYSEIEFESDFDEPISVKIELKRLIEKEKIN